MGRPPKELGKQLPDRQKKIDHTKGKMQADQVVGLAESGIEESRRIESAR